MYVYPKVLIFQHLRNPWYILANLCIGGHLEPSALKFPQHNEDLLQSQPHDHVAPEKKKIALTSNAERRAIIYSKVHILYKDTHIHPIFLLSYRIIICLHTLSKVLLDAPFPSYLTFQDKIMEMSIKKLLNHFLKTSFWNFKQN